MNTRSLELRGALLAATLGLGGCGQATSTTSSASAAASTPAPATSRPTATTAASPAPPAVQPPPSNVPSAAASANLSMEGATVDGFTMKTVSCKLADGNPFTAIGLLKPLAKESAALDACVEKPADVSLHFQVADKKASDIRVAGAPSPEAAICLAKAIEAAAWADPLTCVVTLSLKAKK
ncbi:MAG: hypothetical protein U0414_23485 [Polyangiaceae bacterium]